MPAPFLKAELDRLKRIRVLFEDQQLIAVDKPQGMAVHPGANQAKRSVVELLAQAYRAPQPIHLVHRLDQGTGGVLLLAKSAQIQGQLRWDQFEKCYLALVLGHPQTTTIDQPLPDRDGRKRPARTKIQTIEHLGPASLVAAQIETGRTHQIRRHLAGIGHPVAMDDRHGDFPGNKAFKRTVRAAGGPGVRHLMLHAYRLTGPHPHTRERLSLQANLPENWVRIVQALGGAVDVFDQLP